MRGRRWVPPSISGTPKRRSVKPSLASSVAMRRSHQSASSSPPARHQPEIAAIVGLGEIRREKPSGPSWKLEPRPEALDRLEVGAGAEGQLAGAGDHQHARLVVVDEVPVGLGQQAGGGPVDRVAALLAVDRDDRRRAAALVGDRVGHAREASQTVHTGARRGPRACAVQIPPRACGPVPTGSRPFRGSPEPRYQPTRLRSSVGLACFLALLQPALERTRAASPAPRRRAPRRGRRK